MAAVSLGLPSDPEKVERVGEGGPITHMASLTHAPEQGHMQAKAWLQVRALPLPSHSLSVTAMSQCDRLAERVATLTGSHKPISEVKQHLLRLSMAQGAWKAKGSLRLALSLQSKEPGGVDHAARLLGAPVAG